MWARSPFALRTPPPALLLLRLRYPTAAILFRLFKLIKSVHSVWLIWDTDTVESFFTHRQIY